MFCLFAGRDMVESTKIVGERQYLKAIVSSVTLLVLSDLFSLYVSFFTLFYIVSGTFSKFFFASVRSHQIRTPVDWHVKETGNFCCNSVEDNLFVFILFYENQLKVTAERARDCNLLTLVSLVQFGHKSHFLFYPKILLVSKWSKLPQLGYQSACYNLFCPYRSLFQTAEQVTLVRQPLDTVLRQELQMDLVLLISLRQFFQSKNGLNSKK